MNLAEAATWFFDCDGVLLDSNPAKTEAFRLAAAPYGAAVADQLVEFHVANGGVSRQVKAQYLFDVLLGRPPHDGELDAFLEAFATSSISALQDAPIDEAVGELLDNLRASGASTFVVTGGSQQEVTDEFSRRGIGDMFDGIHGNPRDKLSIVDELFASGAARHPAVFVGDGVMDAQTATKFRLHFVFVRHWSEWHDAESRLPEDSTIVEDLGALHLLLRAG